MKSIKIFLLLISITLINPHVCFAYENIAANNILDPKVVQVYTKAQHFLTVNKQKKIKYTFSVVNQSTSQVYMLTVGAISAVNDEPGIILKPDDIFDVNAIAPKGWIVEDASRGEEPLASVIWTVPLQPIDYSIDYTSIMQPAKTTWNNFILETDKRYSSIYNTYAHIYLQSSKIYSSTIVKGDTVKPTGSVSATVSATPAKAGFYTATIKVTAKDNYDPLPEIALTAVKEISSGAAASPFSGSSYTVNTPNNATTGAYPTAITFKADAKVAKSYQLMYTITDASDNKTEVPTVITIPKR